MDNDRSRQQVGAGVHGGAYGRARVRAASLAIDSRAVGCLHVLDDVMRRWDWLPTCTLWASLLIVLAQALDRRPPLELLRVYPAEARAGEVVTIYAEVLRDSSRHCEVEVYRSLHDARGKTWDYPHAHFSAEAVAMTESSTPGRMAPTFVLPATAAPGPAGITTSLRYRCNKTHALWPITLTHTLPLTVLP